MTLRALLVDDEAAACRNLRALLRMHPEVTITGEAGDAAGARRLIAEHRPDVVFLDIQMPGESGFDLLASIDNPPAIIFVTAFDRYAIRAFEVNALDYLLKPVDPARLAEAVVRIGTRMSVKPIPVLPQDRVLLDTGRRRQFVPVEDIGRILAEGEYSTVFLLRGESVMVRRSLKTWLAILPESQFLRIHRHAIVNIDQIQTIERVQGGPLRLRLTGVPTPVTVSRRLTPSVARRLNA